MARVRSLKSRVLFFTTSPRTPTRMIPDITILKNFCGNIWNEQCQIDFMNELNNSDSFTYHGQSDSAFSARDRINRSPKALGFVNLDPKISITPCGERFITGKNVDDTLLRQLLKFQIPSVYHVIHEDIDTSFWVKPYLEILRLISKLGTISFDELCLFGLQLTDYAYFDKIVDEILAYREEKKKAPNKTKFVKQKIETVVSSIYHHELEDGEYKTRESPERSRKKFIDTKYQNMRDYTDACIRYLRATGLISISRGIKSSISIMKSRVTDVEFILNNVSRDPVFIDDSEKYKQYLFDPEIPILYSDDKNHLIESILNISDKTRAELSKLTIFELSDLRDQIIAKAREDIVDIRIKELRDYRHYQDIIDTFDNLKKEYDAPLIFEWNTWRAMVMIDDGNINGNFSLDDEGDPMSTAPGNVADIECEYSDFGVAVEVTISGGVKQYEMEGESVSRHLGAFKKKIDKDAFGLFIAPTINEAVISHFYALHHIPVQLYGGKSVIVPICKDDFVAMLKSAKAAKISGHPATEKDIKAFFEKSKMLADNVRDETEWYQKMSEYARHWLS